MASILNSRAFFFFFFYNFGSSRKQKQKPLEAETLDDLPESRKFE